MDVSLFDFDLPDELIARRPTVERRASRLLSLTHEGISHGHFVDLLKQLTPKDLLVFNDTRVMAARLYGQKETGGKIEILVERVINSTELLCHMRSSKSPKPGAKLVFDGGYVARMLGREGELFHLEFAGDVFAMMEDVGHVPLPPYIDRPDDESDMERYQTVYAKHMGAVAAPTAGLHFDTALLDDIHAGGTEIGFVTLHVGAGTFQPVREDEVEKHHMHTEWYSISDALVAQVAQTRARGGRVIAVGTTSMRALESASGPNGELAAGQGDTDIFIYPGYRFRQVDAMTTNFHLPKSTLIMLISAFAGRERVLEAYHCAVAEQYRFFSYGDAMFIEKQDIEKQDADAQAAVATAAQASKQPATDKQG